MPASVHHHVGLRVTDLDRAVDFYVTVFGARALFGPWTHGGRVVEQITGAPGVDLRVTALAFDEGFVELFEFDQEPAQPLPYVRQNLLHFGIEVDDVEATLARVVEHGGETVFAPIRLGDVTYCYCRDPDGTVIELVDRPMQELLQRASDREQRTRVDPA